MANTAEQMKVFGYTPEGLDQEVEKYAGEAKEDFEKSKLEEERRANHPLNNVPFFQRPVNASTDDIEVPTSDPDVRAFKNKFGETYTIATSPDQRVEREKLRDGIISSLEGIKGYLENPFLPDKEQVVDFVKGAAVGTLEQIKQSMESGATYGDIFGTLAGVGAASTPFKVPKGSLRLFGGVSMEGAAKDKNLKKAIGLLKDSDFYKFNRPASEEGGISYDLNKKIWSQTGWYVDPADGQWRYFIDDTKASLKNLDQVLDLDISPDARNPSTFKNVKISDVFDHPEFYKRYPEFKNLEVRFFNADPKKGENLKLLGSYDETRNIFSINLGADAHRVMVNGKYHYSTKQLKRTLLHELQHVIQRKENFIRGATTDAIPPDLVYDKDRELRGKKKPIQKKFDEVKSEFDLTDFTLKMHQDEVRNNPLPGLTIQQEIEIYNKHYSQPDKLRPNVTWASTAREYGVPVSRVQKAAGRTNIIALLNKKRAEQGKVYNKLADEVYDVDRERSRIEINFYEGAGGEIEARLTEEMLDPSMTINQLESGATAKDVFPLDARAGMLEREGNLYEYQGKYGVDPFNYEVKPRREPESTNLIDTVKNKFGIADNVKPLTTAEKESLSADFQRIIDPSVNDNPDIFKQFFIDDEYARDLLAELRSPTRDISGDPAKLSEVQSLRNEIYNLTQEGLKDLPEEVTVYRYGPLNERDGVTSFTLNPLYGGSDPSLHLPWVSGKNYKLESYTVKKSDILAAPDLIRDFGEAEIIIRNDAVKKLKSFAKGGTVMNEQMQMAFMDNGGLTDDGMNIDPVSGNEVPSGSMAEEVRDDIPAQLSEGEYVVPADVVRYYGVKFFEDLRDEAKRGLAEMEANGRIGGEPVPAGGPTDGPLTSEEMAVLEELGMAEGGVVNMYREQQNLYSPPNPAIGNTVQMYQGGEVRGYQNSSLVTQPQQAEKDFYSSGQQAQQAGFVGFPLGATVFPTQAQIDAGQTTPAIYQQSEETTFFEPVELINTKPPYDIVLATTQEMLQNYIDQEYVVNDGSFTPPVMGDSGGDGGNGGGEDRDLPDPNAWAEGINAETSIEWVKSNLSGQKTGSALLDNINLAQNYARSAALANIAEAQGNIALANQIRAEMKTVYDNSQFIRMMPGEFIDGSSIGAKLEGKIDLSVKTDKPRKLPPQTLSEFGKSTTRKVKNVKASKNISDKRKGSGMGKSTVKSTGTGADKEYTSPGTTRVEAGTATADEVKDIKSDIIKSGGTYNIGGRNKGGLMTKGKKK